jgi:basic amino acid/polyamine antiporter, APA family
MAVLPARPTLLRILGVGFGIAVVIGGTIGVGILRTPGGVVARVGSEPLAISLWVLGGVYSVFGAVALAELGAMMPQAGGYLVYARRAFGPAIGFSVGWADLVVQCSALAYLSIAVGEFARSIAPQLPSPTIIALATLLLFALLHWAGLRLSSRAQEIMSALKAVGFVGLAIACLLPIRSVAPIPPLLPFPPVPPALPHGAALVVAIVLGFQLVLGTYAGWAGAIYFTEEDTDPARHLPRSLIGGVVIIAAIYLLVNLSLFAVLPAGHLAASTLPAADAAAVVFGGRAARIITVLSIVSLLGIINPLLMIATRIVFALGRERRGAGRVATVSARGTPDTALFIVTAIAVTLVATGTFEKLFATTAFLITGVYGSGMAALIALRRKEPDAERPFRAWGYPWSVGLVLAGSMAFLAGAVASDATNSMAALLLVAVSWPMYFVLAAGSRESRP